MKKYLYILTILLASLMFVVNLPVRPADTNTRTYECNINNDRDTDVTEQD